MKGSVAMYPWLSRVPALGWLSVGVQIEKVPSLPLASVGRIELAVKATCNLFTLRKVRKSKPPMFMNHNI